MEQQNMNWKDYCPHCNHFDNNTGACSKLYFNLSSNPKTFSKKCAGQFYELDKDKKIELLEKKMEKVKKESDTTDKNLSDQQVIIEKGLFSAEGRISRPTYWTRWLIALVINFVGGFISGMEESLVIITSLISIAVSIFIIIQGVKRMHDVNKSGWYIIIPIYNLILAVTDGTPGPNNYGEDPKGRISKSVNP